MATTTNFGWETPDDTDLVKDGAAAIRTALGGVDTSFVDLKGGTTGQVLSKASNTDLDYTWVTTDDANAIQNAIVDAKGDLIAASAADTPARLAVGANGETLVADSSTATGLKWAAPVTGGMTLLSTTSLTGSSVTISSISQDYKDLVGIVVQAYATSTGSGTYLRPNNSTTTSEYTTSGVRNIGSTLGATGTMAGVVASFQVSPRSTTANTTSQKTYAKFEIPRYSEAEPHFMMNRCYSTDGTDQVALQNVGVFTPSSAISSLVIFSDYTFSGGTLYLYGVK